MSCYTRHLLDYLVDAGLDQNKENKKLLDQAVRKVLEMPDDGCPEVWKRVKEARVEPEFRHQVVMELQESR